MPRKYLSVPEIMEILDEWNDNDEIEEITVFPPDNRGDAADEENDEGGEDEVSGRIGEVEMANQKMKNV